MAKIKGAIVVDTERCKGCNLCVVACPLDVIALNKEVNMKGYNYAWQVKEDRKSTRLNSSHYQQSRMPSSA